jgi:stage V sporulation protein K
MRPLVRDSSTHPLVPGCVLGSIAGDPQQRKLHPLDYHALVTLNKQNTLETISLFESLGMIKPDQGEKILCIDSEYIQAFKDLCSKIPEIAETTGCAKASVEQLARTLFSARLTAEYFEILTAPHLSYEKTSAGTVDLLERLFDSFRQIIGGAWSVFFPRHEPSLVTDAAAQFWVACLYGRAAEDIVPPFMGFFRREHKDRLQSLNRGHRPEKGIWLKDALTEYLDNSKEKLSRLYDAVEPRVRSGLDRVFEELAQTLTKLDLPAPMLFYYEFLVQEAFTAFSNMDGSVSSKDNRFIQYLGQQISTICESVQAVGKGAFSGASSEPLESVLGELEELIGLQEVKEKVRQTANFARIQQLRTAQGLKPIATSYHSVYTGNPGTGKTTVARLMGRIYKSLGILKKGHLIECDRSALVAEYVGQTAQRTNAVIDSALDGILFIDEAYSLTKEGEDFGQEVLETLLKRMEDSRDRLIVIVAGYPEEMDRFIHSNPGLHSRFSRFIEFPDYSPLELCRIFGQMCRKNGLSLAPALKEKIIHHFYFLSANPGPHFGNARLVRNCFEEVINAQASRLALRAEIDSQALSSLEADDLHSPADAICDAYRKTGKSYIVKCDHCGETYSWGPDLNITAAECARCKKIYDCEFGIPVAER